MITQEDSGSVDQYIAQRHRLDSESSFHTALSYDAEDFFSACESLPPSATRMDPESPLSLSYPRSVEPTPSPPRHINFCEPLNVDFIEAPYEESVSSSTGDVADLAAAMHELDVAKDGAQALKNMK